MLAAIAHDTLKVRAVAICVPRRPVSRRLARADCDGAIANLYVHRWP
jgi:hypothetical protein